LGGGDEGTVIVAGEVSLEDLLLGDEFFPPEPLINRPGCGDYDTEWLFCLEPSPEVLELEEDIRNILNGAVESTEELEAEIQTLYDTFIEARKSYPEAEGKEAARQDIFDLFKAEEIVQPLGINYRPETVNMYRQSIYIILASKESYPYNGIYPHLRREAKALLGQVNEAQLLGLENLAQEKVQIAVQISAEDLNLQAGFFFPCQVTKPEEVNEFIDDVIIANARGYRNLGNTGWSELDAAVHSAEAQANKAIAHLRGENVCP
jgi:hypothetical protein